MTANALKVPNVYSFGQEKHLQLYKDCCIYLKYALLLHIPQYVLLFIYSNHVVYRYFIYLMIFEF